MQRCPKGQSRLRSTGPGRGNNMCTFNTVCRKVPDQFLTRCNIAPRSNTVTTACWHHQCLATLHGVVFLPLTEQVIKVINVLF